MADGRHINKILSHVRRAVDDYGMIEDGDRIAVGVSGGKDSLTLLCALEALSRFYPRRFTVVPVFLDTALPDFDPSPIYSLCESLSLVPAVVYTEIYRIVFELRGEKNPCSLCALLRRGALNDAALANGCSKVALGHHFDDAVETFMMNLFNEGRIGCFSPVSYLDRKKITVIRPLIYIEEKEIKSFVRRAGIATVEKHCPADGNTDRERIKRLLSSMEAEDRGLKRRIFGAMARGEISGYHVSEGRGRKTKERTAPGSPPETGGREAGAENTEPEV